jgi:hypothetical protein
VQASSPEPRREAGNKTWPDENRLALSFGSMRRHLLGIAAVATILSALIVTLIGARATGLQSNPPRPADPRTTIIYFIADGNGKTGYRSSDRELALWALQAWQRSAGNGLQIKAANESSALIRLNWAGPSDGEYGETRPLIVGGRQGAAVFIRPDMESLGPDIAGRASVDMLFRESIVYFDLPSRIWPRAGARSHTGFPRHHVLLRVRRRRRPVFWPLPRADSLQERHSNCVRPVRGGRGPHSSVVSHGIDWLLQQDRPERRYCIRSQSVQLCPSSLV